MFFGLLNFLFSCFVIFSLCNNRCLFFFGLGLFIFLCKFWVIIAFKSLNFFVYLYVVFNGFLGLIIFCLIDFVLILERVFCLESLYFLLSFFCKRFVYFLLLINFFLWIFLFDLFVLLMCLIFILMFMFDVDFWFKFIFLIIFDVELFFILLGVIIFIVIWLVFLGEFCI